MAIQTIDC